MSWDFPSFVQPSSDLPQVMSMPIISVAKVAKSDCVTEKSDCVTDASFKKKGYPSISFLSNDDCYIHHTQLKSFLKCQT